MSIIFSVLIIIGLFSKKNKTPRKKKERKKKIMKICLYCVLICALAFENIRIILLFKIQLFHLTQFSFFFFFHYFKLNHKILETHTHKRYIIIYVPAFVTCFTLSQEFNLSIFRYILYFKAAYIVLIQTNSIGTMKKKKLLLFCFQLAHLFFDFA